ncbi:PREDICTED: protein tyrosine phosphatase domain-containing protein 1 isoform X4 [Cercocebus atys]|uniref:protein tyrosine phosphatase domain-containing protein 1 isoform X4 n=1 Tax=Cercocebus atys TaxID=9531 RepID=UPI0005F38B63|nr:PREDICTED: protein tyrosine phosphatase domain-containing protein 1 isoform X4 [Cercocebus atys]
MQVQDATRRPSAVHFLSSFLQGRRHSTSDPILRLQQARRGSGLGSGSATKLLSSSSLQVMVAVSSVNHAEGNPTFPERKSKGNLERPTPKYTKVGERLRHVIPGHMACSMACGGRACKYENPARWSEQEQAIKGVYSSWVTDNILAMARPSSELLEKYHIIDQFLSHGIKTIINLQRPGEHASCGNPLEQESGFTYLPEAFMEAGIYFYNFGWKDYGVASLTTILDMVKVMTFALQEGKVAIHCHAGLGRTGVLIACYLVFATRMTADQAIIFVRAKRPNSIQTRGQLLCVREFTQFLTPLRNIFSCCDPKAHAVTLAQYLIRQRHLLHGYEARLLKHVPKIIHLVCKLLLDLAENRPVMMKDESEGPGLSAEIEKTMSEMVTMQLDKELLRNDSDVSNPPNPTAVAADFDNRGMIFSNEQEFDPLWKRRNVECLQPLSHLKRRLSYSDSDLKRAENLLEEGEPPQTVPVQVLVGHNPRQQKRISHCYIPQSPEPDLHKEALVRSTLSFWSQSKFGGLEGLKDNGSPIFHGRIIPKEAQQSRAFSADVSGPHSPGEPVSPNFANVRKDPNPTHQQVSHCQCKAHGVGSPGSVRQNSRTPQRPLDCGCSPKAQFLVEHETQDSKDLAEAASHSALQSELSAEARRILAAKALANLNESVEKEELKRKVEMWQGQHQTILCVLHCVVNLQTIPVDVEEAFLAHAIKAFTKVNFDSENGPIVYNTLKKIFKHTLEEKRKMTKDGPKPGL